MTNIQLLGGSTGGVTPVTPTINISNKVYVDATYGDNVTAEKYNISKPYATINAAKAVAVVGDEIHVRAGTYTQSNIGKNGVNYYFEEGAVVSVGNVSIFSDILSGGVLVCKVRGRGSFITTGLAYNDQCAVNIYRNGSYIDIQAKEVYGAASWASGNARLIVRDAIIRGESLAYSGGSTELYNCYFENAFVGSYVAQNNTYMKVQGCKFIRTADLNFLAKYLTTVGTPINVAGANMTWSALVLGTGRQNNILNVSDCDFYDGFTTLYNIQAGRENNNGSVETWTGNRFYSISGVNSFGKQGTQTVDNAVTVIDSSNVMNLALDAALSYTGSPVVDTGFKIKSFAFLS